MPTTFFPKCKKPPESPRDPPGKGGAPVWDPASPPRKRRAGGRRQSGFGIRIKRRASRSRTTRPGAEGAPPTLQLPEAAGHVRPSPRRPLHPAGGHPPSGSVGGPFRCGAAGALGSWPLLGARNPPRNWRTRSARPPACPAAPALRALPSPALSLCASPRSSRQTAISLVSSGDSSGSCLSCLKATDKTFVATDKTFVAVSSEIQARRDEKEAQEMVFRVWHRAQESQSHDWGGKGYSYLAFRNDSCLGCLGVSLWLCSQTRIGWW